MELAGLKPIVPPMGGEPLRQQVSWDARLAGSTENVIRDINRHGPRTLQELLVVQTALHCGDACASRLRPDECLILDAVRRSRWSDRGWCPKCGGWLTAAFEADGKQVKLYEDSLVMHVCYDTDARYVGAVRCDCAAAAGQFSGLRTAPRWMQGSCQWQRMRDDAALMARVRELAKRRPVTL